MNSDIKNLKCELCGELNEAGVKFCSKCGAQMPDKTEAENKVNIKETAESIVNMVKGMPLKKLLTIAVPAVLFIIALIIVLPMLRGTNFAVVKNNISFFDIGDTVVVSANNKAKFTIEGDMRSSQISLDGSKAALLTDYNYSSGGGTLWFVTTSDRTKIADDVLSYKLSDSGRGVIYFTELDTTVSKPSEPDWWDDEWNGSWDENWRDYSGGESSNPTAELYLYDTNAKRSARITSDALYGDNYMCISPDGKTVGYIGDFDEGDFNGYIKQDGKSAERLESRNSIPLAISNKGKYIYYGRFSDGINSSGTLYVKSGRNENSLIPEFRPSWAQLMFNRDYSQVIFNLNDSSYISRNGNERDRLSNSSVVIVLSPAFSGISSIGDSMPGVVSRRDNTLVYNVKSFANTVVVSDEGNLLYVTNKFETERISGISDSYYYNYLPVQISKDGKTLLFINNSGHLSSINPTKSNDERKELARSIRAFAASDNGKLIYYVNNENDLFVIKNNRDPERIATDVYPSYIALFGNKLFFLADYSSRSGGDLSFSNNGGKRTRVSGASDVTQIWRTPTNLFYITNDDDLYRSSGSEKFSLFQADISGY